MVIHILLEGRALCGEYGLPSEWRDGHRWVRWEERLEATCDACVNAAWKRQAHSDPKVPDEGTNEPKDERPAGRVDVRLSPEHAVAAELFKAGVQRDERPEGRKDEGTEGRFAFADEEGPTLTFLTGKGSVVFTPVSGGIGIVWNGRPRSLCLTHDDAAKLGRWCSSWGTPAPEQLPATLHAAADLLLARYLVAHPKALPSELSVMELVEWSAKQSPVPLPPPLTRTRELLRRFAHDWRESEKDPANGGGKINVDLLTEVCDAFEAEDRG